MAWANTYSFTLAIAADTFTASLLWNRTDITVSSLCALQLRRKAAGLGYNWGLVKLGGALNWIQTGHCEGAVLYDLARANSVIQLLESAPSTSPSPPQLR